MRRTNFLAVAVCIALAIQACAANLQAQVTWNVDNTSSIGGNAVAAVVGSPTVVSTPFGDGLRFDGNDGVIVNANPIAGAANFTIEMLFRPDPIVNATSNQPRVLHIQSPNPPDHRATLETRVVGQQWYLDAFLKSQPVGGGAQSLTLADENKLHPLGEWYNFAMTYDGTHLRAYVNGQLDLPAGALSVLPVAAGQTSLGMRHNRVNFFEGVIAKIRFTPSVVDPSAFLLAYVPGDYDRNGNIEAADYDLWHTTFGSAAGSIGEGADGNRDGIINAADYTVWRDALPDELSDSKSSLAVPEPATFASRVVQLGMIIVLRHRIRQRRM